MPSEAGQHEAQAPADLKRSLLDTVQQAPATDRSEREEYLRQDVFATQLFSRISFKRWLCGPVTPVVKHSSVDVGLRESSSEQRSVQLAVSSAFRVVSGKTNPLARHLGSFVFVLQFQA